MSDRVPRPDDAAQHGGHRLSGLGATLSALYHAMMQRVEADLVTEGFSNVTKFPLYVLVRLGSDALTVEQIADRLDLSHVRVEHLVSSLESRGYLEVVSRDDAGGSGYRVAEHGRRALACVEDSEQRVRDAWRADLGDERFSALEAELEALARQVYAAGPPSVG